MTSISQKIHFLLLFIQYFYHSLLLESLLKKFNFFNLFVSNLSVFFIFRFSKNATVNLFVCRLNFLIEGLDGTFFNQMCKELVMG